MKPLIIRYFQSLLGHDNPELLVFARLCVFGAKVRVIKMEYARKPDEYRVQCVIGVSSQLCPITNASSLNLRVATRQRERHILTLCVPSTRTAGRGGVG